ncbi:hypothetical protein [Candidatus Phytoplasma fraxini]|uniref:Uncharacterized protein n=1 Tax=Ash yellows phytoplasma TaxID=35780 RepID=A0ABZ2U9P5_ASHYP
MIFYKKNKEEYINIIIVLIIFILFDVCKILALDNNSKDKQYKVDFELKHTIPQYRLKPVVKTYKQNGFVPIEEESESAPKELAKPDTSSDSKEHDKPVTVSKKPYIPDSILKDHDILNAIDTSDLKLEFNLPEKLSSTQEALSIDELYISFRHKTCENDTNLKQQIEQLKKLIYLLYKDNALSRYVRKQSLFNDLKNVGITVQELKQYKFGVKDFQNAQYSAKDLTGVFKLEDLKEHYPPNELKDAGFPIKDFQNAQYSTNELKGVFKLEDLKEYCSPNKLTGVFKLEDLKEHYPLNELKDAGFPIKDFQNAQYSAKDLTGVFKLEDLKEHYPPNELKDAGFPIKDFQNAQYSANELKGVFKLEDLKEYCSPNKLTGVFKLEDLKEHYPLNELKDAGFPIKDFQNAQYSAKDLKNVGFTIEDFHKAEYEPNGLKYARIFNVDEIKKCYEEDYELKDDRFISKKRKKGFFASLFK